jgi:hypothetical protein
MDREEFINEILAVGVNLGKKQSTINHVELLEKAEALYDRHIKSLGTELAGKQGIKFKNEDTIKSRTLNVKRVSKCILEKRWKASLPALWPDTLYIRCNPKGEVNWDKAPVYKYSELVERGNYSIQK